ncbi:oligopeptide ABC transporter, ATP-binding protein OppF family protein [Leptospira ryugenii]|uniref:Oligopeptide ABC transporter, ATP-binding protein OppF family protein n=1 Tax=Leptospira ryugenii TaxID=1917863 RepID=A0A2P2DWD4_9LEPT|nr:ATP-binding cassette domain-containing protein [Leptospira ryugenii]GBF48917.1 oligopeptide ABC transporter, ATP-binding protein OppF family protein [Leptospira ryugenii]
MSLVIDSLQVQSRNAILLKNICLQAESGKITGIIGKSGSGKSTIFKCILGLPSLLEGLQVKGQILWEGKPIHSLRQKVIQPVFQDPFTFFSPYLSLEQSLLEPAYIQYGYFSKNIQEEREKILNLLDRFQIPSRVLLAKVHDVSGGQLQRLAILRAILARPKMILLDEPVTALDAIVQLDIVRYIQQINREEKIGFVLVSHDLGLVKSITERVFVLHQGEIVESGPTGEVFSQPKHPFTESLLLARKLKFS